MCLQKAFNVVKFAIERGFLNKFNRQKQEFSYRIGCTSKYEENKDYTFCTLNNKYIILLMFILLVVSATLLANIRL